jgi:hypothetical protein
MESVYEEKCVDYRRQLFCRPHPGGRAAPKKKL